MKQLDDNESESSQYGLRIGIPSSSTHRPFTKQEEPNQREDQRQHLNKRNFQSQSSQAQVPRRNNIFSVQKLYKQTQNLMQNILKVDEEIPLPKKEHSKSNQKLGRKDRSYLKQFDTRNMFGVTLPDYSAVRKKKIQQYFKDRKEIDQESQQLDQELKKAIVQQDSAMKIKKYLKDQTVPEDQKRRLHRLLVKNEKILEVYKHSDYRSIMNSEKIQKRLLFSRSPKQNLTYRKPIYEESREENTYSKLYYKNAAVSFRDQNKLGQKIQSENISESEDTEQFDIQNDQNNLSLSENFGNIVQGLKQKLIQNQSPLYFSYLKNADKIKDLSEYFKVCDQADPITFFSQNQEVFPKKFFVNQQVLANQELDFSNYKLGKHDIQVCKKILIKIRFQLVYFNSINK